MLNVRFLRNKLKILGTVTFTLKAESPNGPITNFQYQAPSGLICSEVVNDQSTCTFNLTEDQMNIEDYSFCYDAVDVLGMVSNRRCLRNWDLTALI